MDKQQQQQQQHGSKPKNNNLFKMLPKAMSFGQRAPPFSPGRDLHRQNQTANRTFFSGPMVRLVPVEARVKKTKNEDVFEEPTSPKVSCIGQIKLAKTKCPAGKNRTASTLPSGSKPKTASSRSKQEHKGHVSKIKRLFSAGAKSPARKPISPSAAAAAPDAAAEDRMAAVESVEAAPSLGQMKKFASSREAFSSFDWTVELTREESPGDHRRSYDSEEETEAKYKRNIWEPMIPHSAPILLDGPEGLKPKKEINLWRRRTMNPPRPLQI